MSAIFTPSGEKEFFTPFGPMMGYVRIPPALVAHLNASMSEQLEDHSGSLVGKVRQELRFPKSLVDATAAALGNALIEYHIRASRRGSFGDYDHTTKRFELNVMAGWFVRQYAHEYNPLHIHTGCALYASVI